VPEPLSHDWVTARPTYAKSLCHCSVLAPGAPHLSTGYLSFSCYIENII
jgi:hypothetical protein